MRQSLRYSLIRPRPRPRNSPSMILYLYAVDSLSEEPYEFLEATLLADVSEPARTALL